MKLIPRKSIATALLLCAATVSQAQTTIKLGWTTADSKVDPYAIAAHYFAEELEAAAPGEFNVQFYPNHQLGNDTAMLQAMQFGTMDAGVITGTQVGTLESAFQLNDLPFLYANNQQAHKVLDGEVGQTLLEKLDAKVLCFDVTRCGTSAYFKVNTFVIIVRQLNFCRFIYLFRFSFNQRPRYTYRANATSHYSLDTRSWR